MGQQQFASSLASFNQQQLDTITTNVAAVQTAVADLKNTDVAQLAAAIVNKKTAVKYRATRKNIGGSIAANTYATILNVTGKGYCSLAALQTQNAGQGLRLTIDGVVHSTVATGLDANTGYAGWTGYVPDGIVYLGGTNVYYVPDTWVNTNQAGCVPLWAGDHIFFNSSFKMEHFNGSASSMTLANTYYAYDVGVYPS